ncbi:MAG: hypothetical protein DRN15_05425 [Thermoprotei archaeon]|nr:MAG: hypothetical protein DRN15_05425 [Thermoprotei archaeon]RLF24038.1 MAG: hypothetical protein DRM97_04005 [Thermoprotei archaeon]
MVREIVLKDIWFSYIKKKYVLRGVNIKLRRGLTLVVGPNASGKTTLLKVASCIYMPDQGRVLVDGVSYWDMPDEEKERVRRNIVYVHESPILIRGSVLDNIMAGLLLRGIDRRVAEKKALVLLERWHMRHLMMKRRSELSRGEQQLVCIIRALLLSPDFMFLDEPLAHLDLRNRRLIVELIRDIKRDRAVVVASNNPHPLLDDADHAILIQNGVVVGRNTHEVKDLLVEAW